MHDDRTQPVIILDDHRTMEWLHRTQAIQRTPALRGGVLVDHKARRQTATGIVIVLFVLIALILFPWPKGDAAVLPAPPQEAKAFDALPSNGLRSVQITDAVAVPGNASVPPAPAGWPARRFTARRMPGNGTRLVSAGSVPTDNIAPHAPVWMDGRLPDMTSARSRGTSAQIRRAVPHYEPNLVNR